MPLYAIEGMRPTLPADGSAWIAPTADVVGDARIGAQVSIWFRAVVRADNTSIIIGDQSNVQEGAMLHSDPESPLTIGNGCTIGHHAVLHGCTIGNNVLVGMAATILNNAVIGDDCLIGAGTLVTEGKQFPCGNLIVGIPARIIRALNETEIARLRASAEGYVVRRESYRVGLNEMAS